MTAVPRWVREEHVRIVTGPRARTRWLRTWLDGFTLGGEGGRHRQTRHRGVSIDRGMRHSLDKLWDAGIATRFSCQGTTLGISSTRYVLVCDERRVDDALRLLPWVRPERNWTGPFGVALYGDNAETVADRRRRDRLPTWRCAPRP